MLTIETVSNLVCTAHSEYFNADVKFAEFPNAFPYTIGPTDTEAHGLELYNNVKAGVYGTPAPYVPPADQPVVSGVQVI